MCSTQLSLLPSAGREMKERGPVQSLLANCPLVLVTDGRTMCSSQSAATSEIVKHCSLQVSTDISIAIASSQNLLEKYVHQKGNEHCSKTESWRFSYIYYISNVHTSHTTLCGATFVLSYHRETQISNVIQVGGANATAYIRRNSA